MRSWQWPTKRITKADPLIITWEAAEELNVDHSMVIWHLKPTGKVKELDKWVPHELTENQKSHRFELSSSLILHDNNEHFLDWIVLSLEKWILCDNWWWPAQWWDWEETPNCSQSQICTRKKVMVTVRWSAAGLIHYSFLNPSETITSRKYAQQIDEMHWKL